MSGTISHREMRNNSAEVLRRVEAGEELIVTNHGRPVARLTPVRVSVLDQLIAEGKARPGLAGGRWSDLPDPIPLPEGVTTADIIADVRGYDRGY